MSIRVAATEATLGAVVTGLELARLSDAEWREVEAAFHEYAVLIFPGQHLTDDEQVAFSRRFGEIQILLEASIIPLSNQLDDGGHIPLDSEQMLLLKGNEGWHTDSSFLPVSAKASILSAHVLPPDGGETEWADMRAAYDALDGATRTRVATLSAHHSYLKSQSKVGHTASSRPIYGFHGEAPPLRPLVKIHPVTKRPTLFIGRHACDIAGLSAEESETLLDELMTFACQPPRVLSHRWSAGDIVVWDNRCVLHRARPYDYRLPRVMKHTRVCGEATEQA